MNILYLNHYAGAPAYGMEFRPYYMARQWTNQGHSVRMLAASYSHVRARQPKWEELTSVSGSLARSENIDGVDYRWYRTPAYGGNGLGRINNIAAFLGQIALEARPIAYNFAPDAVIASSTYPMDIWTAQRIVRAARRQKPCKLVFEVHDLWPLSPIELGGMSPTHPFIRLCQAAENYAYRHADAVVSMLPKVHEHMRAHGLDLNKLTVVPNGVVEQDWAQVPELASGSLKDFLQAQKSAGKKILGYAGSHGQPNALDCLLEAATHLPKDIVCVLVGSGMEKSALQQKAEQMRLANVHFFDPVPKTQIPALLNEFDVAYIGWRPVPIYRFGISPNKLMDYMMAARPIVHSVQAGNDPVAEAQCGLTVPPEDPQAIAQAIDTLFRLPESERARLGRNGREFVLHHHTYRVLAQQFLKAMS